MSKKREARVKKKLAARRKWLREQRKMYREYSQSTAATEYAIAQKVNGRWVYVYKTRHEACRDSMFECLKLTPCPVRRVNL